MLTTPSPTRTLAGEQTEGDRLSDTPDDAAADEAEPENGIDSAAPAPEPAEARPSRGGGDGVRVRELVLLAVAVVGIAGTVFFGMRWKELDDAEAQRTEVEDAAGLFLNDLFEWDGTTIDDDFDRILDHATGEFAEEAQATFNDDEIRQSLRENRAGSRMDELDTFTRSIDGDEARVFAVVDQTAANQEFPEGRADTVRIEIGMVREDGEWKVFDVNVIDGLSLGLPSAPDTTTPAG
jgi:Mce-associated membrane protein